MDHVLLLYLTPYTVGVLVKARVGCYGFPSLILIPANDAHVDGIGHGPDLAEQLWKCLGAERHLPVDTGARRRVRPRRAQVVIMPRVHHRDQRIIADPIEVAMQFGDVRLIL